MNTSLPYGGCFACREGRCYRFSCILYADTIMKSDGKQDTQAQGYRRGGGIMICHCRKQHRVGGRVRKMRFKHTDRPGFLLGLIDFCTAGLFFLFYMPFGGLQDELDEILGRRTQRYWKAYLWGIPTLFLYSLVWMAGIAGELKAKAIELGIEGPYTSWWHMFGWNVFGILLFGPAVATHRFFGTLNRIEYELNRQSTQGR